MTKNKRQFGEVAPVMARLVEHLLLALLEQFAGLFTFSIQVFDENAKVLILLEHIQSVLVFTKYCTQMLIGVGQNVQNEGWRVF